MDRKLMKLTARMLGAMSEEEVVAAWLMARRIQPTGMLPVEVKDGGNVRTSKSRSDWDQPEAADIEEWT